MGTAVRPDTTGQGADTQGVPNLPRILSPDEFEQAQMLSPSQLAKAKFPVLPPPFAPRDVTKGMDPTTPKPKGAPMPGLAGILVRQVVQPITENPFASTVMAAGSMIPGVSHLLMGMMGKDILDYSAQKAAEMSLPADARAEAEKDPERISGEQAGVEAAMLGAIPAVKAAAGAARAGGAAAMDAISARANLAAMQGKTQGAVQGHMAAVVDAWRMVFAPATRSPEARAVGSILRASTGDMAGSYEQAAFKLDEFRRAIDPLPEADKLGFIDAIEGGRAQPNPEFQGAADVIRKTLDETRDAIRNLGTGKLEHFIEDYFPHIWEDPEKAADAFKQAQVQAGSKRPMEGSKAFLKERTIPTTADGIALGLKPVSTNPVDLTLLKLREMQRYLMAHSALGEMKENELVKFVGAGEQAPDGYVRINDKIATVFGPRTGAVQLPEGAQISLPGMEGGAQVARPRTASGRLKNLANATPEELANEYAILKGEGTSRQDARVMRRGPDGTPQVDQTQNARVVSQRDINAALVTRIESELTNRGIAHEDALKQGQAAVAAGPRQMVPEDVRVSGTRIMGQYWAPEPAARVVNNFLSPGLRGNAIYDAYRGLGNTLNQAQLGLSAFHLMFTTMDASVSRAALGLEYLETGLRNADPAAALEGLKNIASTPIAPVTNIRLGARIRSAYLNPEGAPADMVALANAVKEAGGRVRMDSFYQNSSPDRMIAAWKQGEYGKSLALSLPALFETATKPLMEYIVPMQKLGVFGDMAKKALADLPAQATLAERRAVLADVWDSVDNRMGQLVYDNLFWNKTFKDLSMASVRSVGWNIGTIRELGGGLVDIAKMGKAAVTPDEAVTLTHRAAYVAALPIVVGMYGAMYQYLRTGEGPSETKDYFFPKNGTVDADGNPNRDQIASYMKDFFAYGSHPVETVQHKVSPLLSAVGEMLTNKDYFGDEIRNPDDPAVKQMMQEAEFIGRQFMPFSLTNMQEESRRGADAATKFGAWFGITPAKREDIRTPAQNEMADIVAKRGKTALTPEQHDAVQAKSDLLSTLRGGGGNLEDAVTRVVNTSGLTPADLGRLLKRAGMLPMVERFKSLTVEQAIDVFKKADPREQALFAEALVTKVERAAKIRGN